MKHSIQIVLVDQLLELNQQKKLIADAADEETLKVLDELIFKTTQSLRDVIYSQHITENKSKRQDLKGYLEEYLLYKEIVQIIYKAKDACHGFLIENREEIFRLIEYGKKFLVFLTEFF